MTRADRKTARIILPIEQSLLAAIDDWRYANRVPSRAEAIRQAIRQLTETAQLKRPMRVSGGIATPAVVEHPTIEMVPLPAPRKSK